MNILDTTTPPGRELAGILESQARRVGLLKAQGGGIRVPSLSTLRRGMARQSRLDDLRAAALEPLALDR